MDYGNNGSKTISVGAPMRELQMPMSLAELERNIERLMKVTEELEGRLNRICQPEPPQMENPIIKDSVPVPPQAEYIQVLFGNSARVRIVCERLETLLSRLEL